MSGGMEVCIGLQDGCVSGGVTICHCCQRGRECYRKGVMIAGGLLVLPSMLKGEIFDQRLSLMSTQAAPGANPILHRNFDVKNYSILSQIYFRWFLLVDMFPLIYGMPRNSSHFEIYSCLKSVDRKSTRLNSSHLTASRMPSSA